MATVGVGSDTRVLIYASTPRPGVDYGPMWSTRAWWLLHHFGVNCAILDGGYEKWIAEGRPTSTEVTNPGSGNFETNSDSLHALATKDDVLAALGAAPTCVVDAVSEESYAGRKPSAGVKRNGHITGAINVPLYDLITEDFTFADPITLANRFAVSQVPVHGPVITYCGGDVAATLDAFALKLLGCRDVRVYDGSLQEWSADEALPMSTDGNR